MEGNLKCASSQISQTIDYPWYFLYNSCVLLIFHVTADNRWYFLYDSCVTLVFYVTADYLWCFLCDSWLPLVFSVWQLITFGISCVTADNLWFLWQLITLGISCVTAASMWAAVTWLLRQLERSRGPKWLKINVILSGREGASTSWNYNFIYYKKYMINKIKPSFFLFYQD